MRLIDWPVKWSKCNKILKQSLTMNGQQVGLSGCFALEDALQLDGPDSEAALQQYHILAQLLHNGHIRSREECGLPGNLLVSGDESSGSIYKVRDLLAQKLDTFKQILHHYPIGELSRWSIWIRDGLTTDAAFVRFIYYHVTEGTSPVGNLLLEV